MVNKILNHFIALLVTLYIFFYYVFPGGLVWFVIISLVISLILKFWTSSKKEFQVNKNVLLLIIFIFLVILSFIVNQYFTVQSMTHFYVWISFLLIPIFFSINYEYNLGQLLSRYLLFGSILHLVCAFLIEFQIKHIMNALPYILNTQMLIQTYSFINAGSNPGITGQTGRLAFYLVIGLAIVFERLNRKGYKNYIYLSLLVIFVLAVYLTTKRAALIGIILCIIIIYFINLFKKGLTKQSIILFFIAILICISIAPKLIDYINGDTEDISNGRFFLYEQAWNLIEEKPLWGHGFYYYSESYGIGTHNIYLQLWVENGLIALTVYLVFLFYNLYISLKIMHKNKKENVLQASFFIQLFFVIYGFFGNPLYDTYMLLPYFIAIYLLWVEKYERKNFNENRNINIS